VCRSKHCILDRDIRSKSLVDRREDMPSVYASFDVVVSSYDSKDFPIVMLEGMASILP
jgi:glycosyltransferase involved in cell wall biosynthesis